MRTATATKKKPSKAAAAAVVKSKGAAAKGNKGNGAKAGTGGAVKPARAAVASIVRPQASGLGLEGIGDLSGLLDQPGNANNGGPMELVLDLIDEDENQPRTKDNPGFSDESLDELAETIRLRGVKTPISVRDNPKLPGRFIINHGARRCRSSRRAGKTTIPGFIDNDYNEADQVVENLQRNDLTPREIADFIGRELAKGLKKGEIARSIGKSAAFVSQYVTLLDLPEPIAKAFNFGRCGDVTVINELVTAHK
jgi:ParB family chromosome partitioning protein